MLTYQDNIARTGVNNQEHILTPTSVSQTSFGLLYTLPVDGAVYAQPLSVAGVTIPGKGRHNVIYVATEHDSVYAFDANSNVGINAKPLWHVNLGPSVPNGDVGTGDIQPEIGITGTPVIRLTGPGKGELYVLAKTKQTSSNGSVQYVQSLHALDITNGAEALGGPTVIQAVVNGVGDGNDGKGHVPFNSLIQSNRPALMYFANGATHLIVIGWASHGDNGPYHGWVMTYNADTLKQVSVFNTTPNALTDPSGYPIAAGGVWQGGGGIASDGTSLFFATGNGTFDPTTHAYGDSVLRMSPSLQLEDYFSPLNEQSLDDSDGDLGSGGVLLLPNDPSHNPTATLMVQVGKDGTLHLINRANLGQFNSTSDQIVAEFQNVMGGVWGNPAYFNGTVYYGPSDGPLTIFGISAGTLQGTGAQATSNNSFGYPGPTPTVSANGTAGGIVWAVDTSLYNGSGNNGPAQLWAYDATNLNTLYSSANSGGRDVMGVPTKFSVPLVEGGKVFVGTMTEVDVFGIGRFTANPVITTASGSYTNQVVVNVTEATVGAKLYYTLDGSEPTQNSAPLNGSVTLNSNATFQVKAFTTGYGPSGVASAYYQINPVTGTGNGLTGDYYNNLNLTAPITATETDPTLNFNWNGNSPITGVAGTNWSAKWVGYIQPYSTTNYTFYTTSDDGARLFINGVEVINAWNYQAATTYASTPIALTGGQKYTIEVDYFQGGGASSLVLSWSSPGLPMQVVPQSQLYTTQ
jgi:hypothetical protein